MSESSRASHREAASLFAERIQEQYASVVDEILLFGSVAREEHSDYESDVDLLVVLTDDADRRRYESSIREAAYDIELETGIVLSIIVTTASNIDRELTQPFIETVRADAQQLYG